ncbi:MAG TPA: hypothetical protein DCX25_03225 [Candidatus Pacebacteria bacterium]|nr:hypothetical protein [Candidatus Paceibacterota bacterium]HCR11413.1 hypothetical protein [Candidatus Paceibacterota bacterium]HCR92405.1 hypothetical protein [Candidatus Paceibacterota bacterium]
MDQMRKILRLSKTLLDRTGTIIPMIIFDGNAEVTRRKTLLAEKVKKLPQLSIYSLVFQEDVPSTIYAHLKKKDAESIGVGYELDMLPIATPAKEIIQHITQANARADIQGIIVQKPGKHLFPFQEWWSQIVSVIDPKKDVDGLTGKGAVVPATARAILEILDTAVKTLKLDLKKLNIVVLGRSDIVGVPVAKVLEGKARSVLLYGKDIADHMDELKHADVVITATGQTHLLHAANLKYGVIIIDAGSPKPEVDPAGLEHLIAFLSPVPGGVGPMTRVCLLQNLIDGVG